MSLFTILFAITWGLCIGNIGYRYNWPIYGIAIAAFAGAFGLGMM